MVFDLLLAGADARDRSPRDFLHRLVCADLKWRSEDFGLSVDPFPQHIPVRSSLSAYVSKAASANWVVERVKSCRNAVDLVIVW